ncbi:16S rRNA (uracil(1498)-N(3))-methyltransferase [Nocardioides eburneiflavus]|uniref:Ribosomal RNA small subunit methyltransferase E n=1 Tax=Nocardioides eburneiflavus TaxID=2518372 RepID=A0A4Z1CGI7_9ACTN|nr:16S rRNA (uracil(1498)-N(3))-methyltransferase [Nocardioides eburneiflavus]TGN64968.1 16S rRNA (uracil(1498)-N(3))-methyltransferase [Nocardioides eburneiflavus]
MSLPVHLVESLADVSVGSLVEVTGDEAHHAVAVRRLREGEQVVLTDGLGTSVTGSVASTGKRVFTVTVAGMTRDGRPEPAFTVVQALPKGDRGELAVEVLTEVGIDVVVPWAASRSVAVWKGERAAKSHAKWQATAREAAKQSRRSWLPTVTPLASTADLAALVAEADLAVVLHEDATLPLSSLDVPASGRIVVVVGPEGGIAPDELAALADAGAHSVRLGAEVLRTSTAGVAAVAALLARTPRWG